MIILNDQIIESFNAKILSDELIEFTGDNNEVISYNSMNDKWYGNKYFKVIDDYPSNNPSRILIFCQIQEAILYFNNRKDLNIYGTIMIVSDISSVYQLLEYLFNRIVNTEIRSVYFNFFQRENSLDAIYNLISINNFYTADKIIIEYLNGNMKISNNIKMDLCMKLD